MLHTTLSEELLINLCKSNDIIKKVMHQSVSLMLTVNIIVRCLTLYDTREYGLDLLILDAITLRTYPNASKLIL